MYAQGKFKAEVLGGVLTKSSSKGTEQVAVTFRLLEGPDEGRDITAYLALTDARLPYTVKELRLMGWKDDLNDLLTIQGSFVDLVLEHEQYNGKTQTKVKFINAPGTGGVKAADDAAAIADRWRAKIAALPREESADPF